ncbi:hypothetical protein NKJ06_20075 [Mesorhizobium sp. M0293]|uniref:hypothetical protein n=1 Tax=Mesorhizobium sp. M0293 TaxID=2956930 RepID=UPI00333B24E0
MIERIDAHGLFSPRQSKVTLEVAKCSTSPISRLTDFQVIDEPAFNKLSDEAPARKACADWHDLS